MRSGRDAIRAIAVAVIRKGDAVLVQHGVDPLSGGRFYRLPGGGIEHGERAVDALRREFREELGAELVAPMLLTVIENIFAHADERWHEIVFVFETRLANPALYEQVRFVIEETSTRADGSWKTAADFTRTTPLYPPELLPFIGGSAR